MRALTYCDAKITSTCTTAGQIKGQFKGAMEESSMNVQKMQAHIRSDVVVDIAAFKVSHSAGFDKDTVLQERELRCRAWVRPAFLLVLSQLA